MFTAFILAAGFGTRLRPLTDHIPKALTPVCGKPLLERGLEFLSSQGVGRIGVNAHAFADQMEAFRDGSSTPFELFHETGAIRGTGGAFRFARDFLEASPVFFACNADIIADVNLKELYERFLSLDCLAGLVAAPSHSRPSIYYDKETGGYLGASAQGTRGGEGADFTGMAFYRKEFLDCIAESDFSVVPVWTRAAQAGFSVKVIEAAVSYWKDAGTPGDLAQVHFDVMEGRCGLSLPAGMHLDRSNTRAWPASLDENSRRRLGSCVWMEASGLPPGVTVERSIVLKDAVLSPNTHYRNALLTRWGSIDCGL